VIIVLKFILKSINEKKFRTFLVIFAIAISTALVFASIAISDTFVKMHIERMKQYYGNAEIMIYANSNSPSSVFYTKPAEEVLDQLEYIIGVISSSAGYKSSSNETVNISVQGIDYDDLQKMNPLAIKTEGELYPFDGRKIIINSVMAEKYKLSIGEHIELEFNNGNKYSFMICSIAYPTGMLAESGQNNVVIVPREALSSIYDIRGKVAGIYIKSKNSNEIPLLIKELSKIYSRYTVCEPFTKEEIKHNTSQMATPFKLMTFIVSFMSIFIIYSSFKVIMVERMPIIGTFRSIGSTRKMTNLVMLIESFAYSVFGGFIGCGLGIGVLYFMAENSKPSWMSNVGTSIEFNAFQLIGSFIFAVVLCLGSSLVPIIKVSTISVRNIVLNSLENKEVNKLLRVVVGIIFLVASIVFPWYVPRSMALYINAVFMVLSIVSVILLIPYITAVFVKVFEKVYSILLGNEGLLAAKNLRENKTMLNSISLLAISISSLLMINTVSYSVVTEITNYYKDALYDITVQINNANRDNVNVINTIEGVDDAYGIFEAFNTEVVGTNYRITLIQGIDTNKYLKYYDLDISEDSKDVIYSLDAGRNILVTYNIKDKYNLKKGDNIKLRFEKGEKSYKVIGFFNNAMESGDIALVSERFLKLDNDQKYYSRIYVKASMGLATVTGNIRSQFIRKEPRIMTVDELEKMDRRNYDQMFNILKGFTIMTIIIGIFGVINNLIIGFLKRKRVLAIFRSIGMAKVQIVKMIIIESLTGGVIGSVVGVFAGILMVFITPCVLKAIDMSVPMHFSLNIMITSFLAGLVINFIASISPALKSSKLNIIEAIKYE